MFDLLFDLWERTAYMDFMMTDTLQSLLTRRSVKAKDMIAPGPDAPALDQIIRAGIRVPDHGKLAPWRFIVMEGEGRARFGRVLQDIFCKNNPGSDECTTRAVAELPMRAPMIVTVVSELSDAKPIPEWEQRLSAGAVCMNMLNAAHALGYAGQWLTEWPAFDEDVANHLGLGTHDKIAGFLYFGTAAHKPDERPRPEPDAVVSRYAG